MAEPRARPKAARRLSQMFDDETAEAKTRRLSKLAEQMKSGFGSSKPTLSVDTNLRGQTDQSSPLTGTSTTKSFPTSGTDGAMSPTSPIAQMVSPRVVTAKVQRKLSHRANLARAAVSERFHEKEKAQAMRYWRLILALAIASASLSFGIDFFTMRIGDIRSTLTNFGGSGEQLILVCSANVAAVLVGRLVVRQCVEAEGSGFPDMKAMIFGKVMPNYLTAKVLVIKAFALSMVVGAGLPAGKEGPNVHMAGCIGRVIAPQYFSDNLEAGTSRGRASVNSILLACCAVGVAASFSSPLGGVVFTVEFMLPQLFDRDTYWGCFVATVIGSLSYAIWRSVMSAGSSGGLEELISTNVKAGEGATAAWPVTRSLLDVALGMLCGLMAGLWIICHTKVNGWLKKWRTKKPAAPAAGAPLLNADGSPAPPRKPWLPQFQWRDLAICAAITILNTFWAASLPMLSGKPQPKIISELFDKHLMEHDDNWRFFDIALTPMSTMLLCLFMKWCTTVLTLAMAMPTGVVAPTMIIGGLIGRCFVLLIPAWFADLILGITDESPEERLLIYSSFMARFGIVGAAAFCAGVTRCFAMAITIFECTALPSSVLPLCFSSLAAIFVANRVALPFFDMNLVGRGLGGIPFLSSTDLALRPVFNVMNRIDLNKDVTRRHVTPKAMRQLLASSNRKNFAVVEFLPGTPDALLCGNITRESLETFACFRTHPVHHIEIEDEIDLLNPEFQMTKNGYPPLVDGCPMHVDSSLTVKDVYITLKITNPKEHLYVTAHGRLLGALDFADLLVQKV
mmetsp:Transcript_99293/g.172368  ORF Transcript_99293/g.172368 Transcript_99293/m.172368 type:complete len:793 (+) Transcript_99293:64-2442(+)